MKCKYCGKKAVAILNGNCPLCQEHAEQAALYCLECHIPLGMAVKGEVKYIALPSQGVGVN